MTRKGWGKLFQIMYDPRLYLGPEKEVTLKDIIETLGEIQALISY